MNIYKLKYESQEIGISDLLAKGILLPGLDFCLPVHAVVDLGGGKFDLMIDDIIEVEATEGTPSVYKVWDFGANEIHPETPDHTFAGYEPIIIEN